MKRVVRLMSVTKHISKAGNTCLKLILNDRENNEKYITYLKVGTYYYNRFFVIFGLELDGLGIKRLDEQAISEPIYREVTVIKKGKYKEIKF